VKISIELFTDISFGLVVKRNKESEKKKDKMRIYKNEKKKEHSK